MYIHFRGFMRTLTYTVPDEYSNRPLIHFLRGGLGFSTHMVSTLRHTENSVLADGKRCRMIDKIHAGETIEIHLPEKSNAPELFDMPLDIIFEDSDILVINKPSGISVHPTHNHPNGTLSNAVAFYLLSKGHEPSAARAVGRLDKVTSGVMIFAKNLLAASALNGKLQKTYYAVADGTLEGSGTVDKPIYRPDEKKTMRAVGENGDRAVTHWQALKCGDSKTLLRVTTETGRTHQIRVHLSSIGHPLAGDDMYGAAKTDTYTRAALHCAEVKITHPVTKELLTLSAPLPSEFNL